KDRCLCPANFTGKFCQIPVPPLAARPSGAALPSSTNEIVKPVLLSGTAANHELMRSEFLLPLGPNQEVPRSTGESQNARLLKMFVFFDIFIFLGQKPFGLSKFLL
ncbi:hypothetical protein XENOCAPTIV_026387, partial [Xenoophorus captivus]